MIIAREEEQHRMDLSMGGTRSEHVPSEFPVMAMIIIIHAPGRGEGDGCF